MKSEESSSAAPDLAAAAQGRNESFQYMLSTGCVVDDDVCKAAAAGSIAVLQHVVEVEHCRLTEALTGSAAKTDKQRPFSTCALSSVRWPMPPISLSVTWSLTVLLSFDTCGTAEIESQKDEKQQICCSHVADREIMNKILKKLCNARVG